MIIQNYDQALCQRHSGSWDDCTYNIVYLRKPANFSTNYRGVLVDEGGRYLSYPITEIGDLRGKIIEIEFEKFVAQQDPRYILDLGNSITVKLNGTTNLVTGYGGINVSCIDDVNKNSTICTMITGTTNMPNQFIIGNSSNPSSPFIFPIKSAIKKVTIKS